MTRRYDHILIDLDNTVFDFAVCEKRILEAMAREFGYMPRTIDDRDLTTAYREINGALWRAFERGEISGPDLQLERFRRLEAQLDYSAISRRLDPAFLNQQFLMRLAGCAELVPTAEPVVRALAPVVAVTNGFAAVQRPRVAASGLEECFSAVYISEEIGVAKPAPAFFGRVLDDLGEADPARCLMIGDSLSSDVAGGNAAGMDTVWFDRSEHFGIESPTPARHERPTYRISRLVQLRTIVFDGSS